MPTFYALVHKDPASAFGITFPDVPNVFAAADERVDIVSNAAEALSLYAETDPLPEPSTFDELMKCPDVKKELENGAFVVAVLMLPAEDA